jgi:small subunit ribosomal protein S6
VNAYELMLILDPEVGEERHDEILARLRELVEQGGGGWVSHEPWGRRRLAYEIDKKDEGVYHLMHFDVQPDALNEITRVLRITDGVLRHMAVRRPAVRGREEGPAVPAG